MIQDIFPYRLDTAYRDTVPAPDDRFFSFQGEDVLGVCETPEPT